ncbi:MAG: glycogen/starch/alpha-glucan phosphorylase, partial [Catonella sp.]
MKIRDRFENLSAKLYGRPVRQCTEAELFHTLLVLTKELMADKKQITGERKLYYISAEFLIGKLLSNNLINLGVYDEIEEVLKESGKSIAAIEDFEPEPSLGNGGLGRLAACFLDSIASLGLNGCGVGLLYHFGLFKQTFNNHLQNAVRNEWITDKSWLTKTDLSFDVKFGDRTVRSTMYDIDVVGYDNGIGKLHLFDVNSVDESLVGNGIDFDKNNIEKNLTLFLYPDDSDEAGHLLRIYQQYFMVSNAARLIIKDMKDAGHDLHELHKYAVVQINDTHPTMVIPELIRILTQEEYFT